MSVKKPIDKSDTNMLDDFFNIGPNKPMGYLEIFEIISRCEADPCQLEKYLNIQVITTKRYNADTSECLYAYDKQALSDLLERNKEVLEKANWPTDPDNFVKQIASIEVESGQPLYDLIADAFADYTHPLRSDKQ